MSQHGTRSLVVDGLVVVAACGPRRSNDAGVAGAACKGNGIRVGFGGGSSSDGRGNAPGPGSFRGPFNGAFNEVFEGDVEPAVDDAEGDPIDDAEGDAIDDTEGDTIDDAEGDSIGDAIDDAEGDPIDDPEGDPIDDVKGVEIDDAEGDAIDDAKGVELDGLAANASWSGERDGTGGLDALGTPTRIAPRIARTCVAHDCVASPRIATERLVTDGAVDARERSSPRIATDRVVTDGAPDAGGRSSPRIEIERVVTDGAADAGGRSSRSSRRSSRSVTRVDVTFWFWAIRDSGRTGVVIERSPRSISRDAGFLVGSPRAASRSKFRRADVRGAWVGAGRPSSSLPCRGAGPSEACRASRRRSCGRRRT